MNHITSLVRATVRTPVVLGLTFTAAILLILASTGSAGEAAAAPTVKNVVLVHGAFADGSSWAKVIPLLEAKGLHVTAVQNPLSSLADDVAATKRAIANQDGPVILVGHSWAGMVISEAGNDPKVAGLVYVAALVPDEGQSANDVLKPYPPPLVLPKQNRMLRVSFRSPAKESTRTSFPIFSQRKEPSSMQLRVPGIRHASPIRCRPRLGRQNHRGSSQSTTGCCLPNMSRQSRNISMQQRRLSPPATCPCYPSRKK